MGEKGEGIKCKLVVTEQLWGGKGQQREYSSQRRYMNDLQTWTTVWGLPEVVGMVQVEEEKRGKLGQL